LGEIYQVVPWKELAKNFKLKEPRKGRGSMFSPQGKLALMFIKPYTGLSDRKLIDNINGSIHLQMFCGILLGPEQLRNFKIVSRIRTELASKLNISVAQQILAKAWKPYIKDPNVVLEDATCYESYIRYPTNVKMLWECVEWM
jgi:hypothetical protein